VKILLVREEVHPDKPNYHSRTPLSFAAQNGHEEWWKYYLGRKRSTLISQIIRFKHLTRLPLRMDMREW